MRNLSLYLFLVALIASFLLILIASTDPLGAWFTGTIWEYVFVNSISGNGIIFNVSIGVFVSCVFYIIVVFIPDRQKRSDLAPELDRYVAQTIVRIYAIVHDISQVSNEKFDIKDFTKSELMRACKSFNPKLVTHKFQGTQGIPNFVERDFGFRCANHWAFAIKGIDETMRYLPYVDTGLVKILNQVRNSNFSLLVPQLENLGDWGNTDMASWSDSIYEAYQASLTLSQYYAKYINKCFVHPSK
ncbi:hypothetical protein [Shewanella morhuae]|uniref:Uncharacterized protein n=1 Tax=Shewanella morhuae TaxID=365591 RepID=A0A380C5Z7_9GAMM|nr:hypothetical protein [Shewanella morhuae]SUI93578.1 Uncharacterised protein [Shewanella morhuae]SUJ13557.1 Uncharacterised protein [Shewanella morhuae]